MKQVEKEMINYFKVC